MKRAPGNQYQTLFWNLNIYQCNQDIFYLTWMLVTVFIQQNSTIIYWMLWWLTNCVNLSKRNLTKSAQCFYILEQLVSWMVQSRNEEGWIWLFFWRSSNLCPHKRCHFLASRTDSSASGAAPWAFWHRLCSLPSQTHWCPDLDLCWTLQWAPGLHLKPSVSSVQTDRLHSSTFNSVGGHCKSIL